MNDEEPGAGERSMVNQGGSQTRCEVKERRGCEEVACVTGLSGPGN